MGDYNAVFLGPARPVLSTADQNDLDVLVWVSECGVYVCIVQL